MWCKCCIRIAFLFPAPISVEALQRLSNKFRNHGNRSQTQNGEKEVAPSVIKGVYNMSYLPNLENVRNVLKKTLYNIHLFLACAGILNAALTVAALARKMEYVLQPFLLHELLHDKFTNLDVIEKTYKFVLKISKNEMLTICLPNKTIQLCKFSENAWVCSNVA